MTKIRAIGPEGETTLIVPELASLRAHAFYRDAVTGAYTRSFGVNPLRVEVERVVVERLA